MFLNSVFLVMVSLIFFHSKSSVEIRFSNQIQISHEFAEAGVTDSISTAVVSENTLVSLPCSCSCCFSHLWFLILIDHWLSNKLLFRDNKDLLLSTVWTGHHLLNSNPLWFSMSVCNYSQPNILLCSAVNRDSGVLTITLLLFVIFIDPLSCHVLQKRLF